jgi:transcriptional regulator with XRE-family HTH domain
MLLNEKHFSYAEFARRCNLSISYVNSVRTSLSFEVLCDLSKLFPDLNLAWLITGNPPMLLTAQSELESAQKELTYLRDKVAMQEDIIRLMKRSESGDKPTA